MTKPQDKTLAAILTSAQLPTLPLVASRLLELTAREDAAFTEIVGLIAQDVALSAKLLKVANSAFFNFPQQIISINQAVSLLGLNAVRSLVLSFTFLSMGRHQEIGLFRNDLFWERSLTAATAARLIAERVPSMDTDEIFTICLLCDIGQLIFALTLPRQYTQALQRLADSSTETNPSAIEQELLAAAHTTVGAEAARFWGLPAIMQAAIRHHHDPTAYDEGDAQTARTINIVYLADLVAGIFHTLAPERCHQRFCTEAESLLGLEPREIHALLAAMDLEIAKAALSFDVTINPVRPVDEIIQEANIRLSLLHLSYEEMNRELVRTNEELARLKEQLDARNRLLEALANIDGLTGISNHRFFQSFLQAEIVRTTVNGGAVSLLLFDIDHFKRFNDAHGHRTGDFILKELCQVAASAIREYDILARYGGEEFVVVLPDTGPEGAMVVADRVCQVIAGHDFVDGFNHFQVTVSIGVASLAPTDADNDRNQLIDMADKALYEAKRQGRNRVCQYSARTRRRLPFGCT